MPAGIDISKGIPFAIRIFTRRTFMKQGTLFYDRESGRYNFHYTDEDGDRRDYGGIHCGEVFE